MLVALVAGLVVAAVVGSKAQQRAFAMVEARA